VTDSGEESDNWVAVNEHAGLGLPVAPGEHHRLVRRLVARLGRPFLAHQVEYNRALLAELVTIRDSLVAQTIALGASTTEQFAALVEQVDALGVRCDELAVETRSLDSDSAERIAGLAEQIGAHLEVLGARLDGLGKRLDGLGRHLEVLSALVEEHSVDRDLVHAEVELGQQHAIEHIREACDGIRGDLSDLRRQTEKRQRELERAIGRAR
jgi:hypothetical protein